MIPVSLLAAMSLLAFLALWFRTVWREMLKRSDTAASAKTQLDINQRQFPLLVKRLGTDDAKALLARSEDIYQQAATLYNQALAKPCNIVPGLVLGFRFKSIAPQPGQATVSFAAQRAMDRES